MNPNRNIPSKIILKSDYAKIILLNRMGEKVGESLISLEDVERVKPYKWNLSEKYGTCSGSKVGALKSFILGSKNKTRFSHINGNLLDCRRENLESRFKPRKEITKYTPNKIKIKERYAVLYLRNKDQEVVGKVRIDLEDVERVSKHKWCLAVAGYAFSGSAKLLHRFIMNYEHTQYDHKNRNKLDCRKKNLRPCTEADNHRNRVGYGEVSAKGVWFSDKKKSKYRVSAPTDFGKNVYLGTFENLIEAAEAYNRVASKCKTKIIVLNDLEELNTKI